MEPTKVDPVACARLIVYGRIASGLCERNRTNVDDLRARESPPSTRVGRLLVPPNIALMIASIVSSVAVVLWCIAAQ